MDNDGEVEDDSEPVNVFKDMPMHLREQLTEDILISIVQNMAQQRLTPLPSHWKVVKQKQRAYTTKKIIDRLLADINEYIKNSPKYKGQLITNCQIQYAQNKREMILKQQEQQNDIQEEATIMLNKNKFVQCVSTPNGYPCLMYWPHTNQLIPVKYLNFNPQDAKYLQVQYYKPNHDHGIGEGHEHQNLNTNHEDSKQLIENEGSQNKPGSKKSVDSAAEKIKDKEGQNVKTPQMETEKSMSASQKVSSLSLKKKQINQKKHGFSLHHRKNNKKKPKLVKENYNLIQLHIESINGQQNKKLQQQGIKFGQCASDYLRNKICCSDPRIGNHNVLKLTHSALQFERIFVFFVDVNNLVENRQNQQKHKLFAENMQQNQLQKIIQLQMKDHFMATNIDKIARKGIIKGEQNLNYLISAFKIVIDQLLIKASELYGHIAAVKQISMPQKNSSHHHHHEEDDAIRNIRRQKQQIDLKDKYLVEIVDLQLDQILKQV